MKSFATLALSASFLSTLLASPGLEHNDLSARRAHAHAIRALPVLEKRVLAEKRAEADPIANGALLLAVANSTITPTNKVSPFNNATSVPLINSTATWFAAPGRNGACAVTYNDTALIVGIPLRFWNATTVPSPYCGSQVYVLNPVSGQNVTAIVGDASGINELTMSRGAFKEVGDLDAGSTAIQWQFVSLLAPTRTSDPAAALNAAIVAAGSARADSASSSSAAAAGITPGPSAAEVEAASASSASSASSANAASLYYASSVSKASADAAWASSSSAAAAAASSSAAAAWASEQASSSATAAKASKAAAQEAVQVSLNVQVPALPAATKVVSQVFNGGIATFFYQNGVAGACGKVNLDSAYVIAIDQAMYNGGANCGRSILITRLDNGATVTAVVADMCPTCENDTSLDLSMGAFKSIASESEGIFKMKWQFV